MELSHHADLGTVGILLGNHSTSSPAGALEAPALGLAVPELAPSVPPGLAPSNAMYLSSRLWWASCSWSMVHGQLGK